MKKYDENRKNIFQEKDNPCISQEHLKLRHALKSRENEHEIFVKPDTLLEEPCVFILGLVW